MLTVKETIAAYEAAIADEDRVTASRLLESLEDERFCNETDWRVICDFLKNNKLHGRLEIITSSLIKEGKASSGKPFIVLASLFMKAGRISEAKPLLAKYKEKVNNLNCERWEYLNLLITIEEFSESLLVVKEALEENPKDFPYLIMESRIYWKMNDRRKAKKKLINLMPYLGTDADQWLWYASVATEYSEPLVANDAILRLIKLLQAGKMKLSKEVTHVIVKAGHKATLMGILEIASPAQYQKLPELEYVYELAISQGSYKAAKAFGQEILQRESNHVMREKIQKIMREPEFLMS